MNYPKIEYVAELDPYADNPNEWEPECQVRVIAEAYLYHSVDRLKDHEEHEALDMFAALLRGGTEFHLAARVTQRWTDYNVVIVEHYGYSKGSQKTLVAVAPKPDHAEAVAKTWSQWAQGDVYRVVKRETSVCNLGHEHAEDVDAVGGFYAETAEEAIAQYKEDYA